MDANKLEVLRALPFSVQKVCGLCKHGAFVYPHDNWGSCMNKQYEHKKHTGPPRQLSIVRFGTCPGFEVDDSKKAQLGAFQEFLK